MEEPGLHREFQNSQSYIVRPFLEKANKQIKSEKVNWKGNPEHDHRGTCPDLFPAALRVQRSGVNQTITHLLPGPYDRHKVIVTRVSVKRDNKCLLPVSH